jgi:hypothetical protein
MPIEKKKFVRYDLDSDKKEKPLSVKLNKVDKEMIAIGMYALNMHSKSGVLKELADIGLKVLLDDLGMEKMHYFTSGDRVRVIHSKPQLHHYREKVERSI